MLRKSQQPQKCEHVNAFGSYYRHSWYHFSSINISALKAKMIFYFCIHGPKLTSHFKTFFFKLSTMDSSNFLKQRKK